MITYLTVMAFARQVDNILDMYVISCGFHLIIMIVIKLMQLETFKRILGVAKSMNIKPKELSFFARIIVRVLVASLYS